MNLFSLILASISTLVQDYVDYDKEVNYKNTLDELRPDLNFPRIKTYDFIVIGGGTAGSVVAGRLSEKFNVLLLESGGNPPPVTESQFFSGIIQSHPSINNIFESVPQQHYARESGGIIITETGRMLGGSGSHNENAYHRGSPYDYDNFARITGDNSWNYRNALRHFKNFERHTGPLINENERTEFYADRGPLTVETKLTPILPAWFQAARELGYSINDPNGNQTEGFAPLVMSMVDGIKQSAYKAFVKPFQSSRRNLTVLTYSEVEQVLINDNKVAYGVLYRRHGIIQVAHASKEVIVSAGTISSPLLLIRSGIGPKDVLMQAKIPVLSDLRGVGKNLRNHGAVSIRYTVDNPNRTLFLTLEDKDMQNEIIKYHKIPRTGILTGVNFGQAYLVSHIALADGQGHWPDTQIGISPQLITNNGLPLTMSTNVKVMRMKSAGEIRFNVSAYLNGERSDVKLAIIDQGAFTDPSDRDVLIEGIRKSLQIMETTTPFQNMGVRLSITSPQNCSHLEFRSNPFWECYAEQRAQTLYHIVGTCAMGRKSDPMTVVDSKLRVLGIQRLRVIDASVLPRTTNAQTNAAVMLVAEKTSQEILTFYGN